MKVSVVMYTSPDSEDISLGVISGCSMANARKLAMSELNDDNEFRFRLTDKDMNQFTVEESWREDEGEADEKDYVWSDWEESGAKVYINTYVLDAGVS